MNEKTNLLPLLLMDICSVAADLLVFDEFVHCIMLLSFDAQMESTFVVMFSRYNTNNHANV
jgi:hypothetical protein